jgi:hypothetical protein
MEKVHTEGSIQKELRSYFQNGYNYQISNAFIFGIDWESDFFCVNREGWAFEFEVKVSRSDFKADLKKKRHQILLSGLNIPQWNANYTGRVKNFIPNRFYYVVPKGLVTLAELPEYAGLIEVENYLNFTKRAPFIHRRKLELRKTLCDKFFHRYLEQRRKTALMEFDYKQLKKRLTVLKEKYPNEFILNNY